MNRKIFSLLSAAVLVLALGSMAKADTIETFTQGLYSATLDLGATSAQVTLDGPSSGFYVYEVALMLGGSTASDNTGSASSGSWTFLSAQNANTCGTNKVDNWLCADTGTAGDVTGQAGNGLVLTYNFTGTPGAAPYALHFIICSTATDCIQGGDTFVTIFSQTGSGTSTVPEPGSLALFGTGILGIAGFLRRKLLS